MMTTNDSKHDTASMNHTNLIIPGIVPGIIPTRIIPGFIPSIIPTRIIPTSIIPTSRIVALFVNIFHYL